MSNPINHVVIFHGYAGSPEKMWFPWLHKELEMMNVVVTTPVMPSPLRPRYADWLKVAKPLALHWNEKTLIIAHSLGGVLALRALEKYAKKPVGGVILVSSPFTALVNVKPLVEFFDAPIDWEKLRHLSKSYVVLHAKDDPLIPDDHARRYAEALGTTPHLSEKGGHLISKTYPALLNIIKKSLDV